MPILLVGSVLATIGTGLIYTIDIGTSSSKWIGYQALAGIGLGLAFQVPMIANQAFVKMDEIASVTAVTLCKSLLPRTASPIANSSSLPNHWWSILRLGRPNSIRQPSYRSAAYNRSRGESCTRGGDGRNATSNCFPGRAHCGNLDRIHGRLEAFLCTGDCIRGCDLADSVVCEMAEREAQGRRCGCMMMHGTIGGYCIDIDSCNHSN